MPKQLASTLHLLLCKKSHQDDCPWYTEDQQVEHWELPEHVNWFGKAEGIIRISGQSSEEINSLLRQLVGIITQLSFLKSKHAGLSDIIDTIVIQAARVKD